MRGKITFVLLTMFICQINLAQSIQWAKSFQGGSNSFGKSVAVDSQGNVYTTGPLRDVVDFDPGPGVFQLSSSRGFGGSDIFVSKLDRFGNFKWARQFSAGYTSNDQSTGEAIAVDSSGNVYVGGNYNAQLYFNDGITSTFIQSGHGISKDIFISKLSKDGSLIWTKGFGGDNYDIITSLTVDNLGNVFSTGIYQNTAGFGAVGGLSVAGIDNYSDIFILKQDTNGNSQWVKRIGGSRPDWGNAVTVDSLGNVYTTGYIEGDGLFNYQTGLFNVTVSSSGPIVKNIYVSKMDPLGNFIWVKSTSSISSTSGTVDNRGNAIKVDNKGNVIITGMYYSANDFDPGANTFILTPNGQYDLFVEKFDALGNFKWVKSVGSTGDDYSNGIAIDYANNIYMTGRFQSTVDFDPANGVSNLTATSAVVNGNTDCFISKLDSSGNYVWAKRIGGTSSCIGNSIVVDLNNSIYTTGQFAEQVDFDPDNGVFNLTTSNATTANVFVLKLAQCNTPVLNNVTNQTVCNNSLTTAVNFTSTPTIASTGYSWTNNNSQIGLASSGTGNIQVFTALNSTSNPITSIITVVSTVKTSKYAYIPNYNSNTVSVIDLANNNVIATIGVGSQPTGVAITPDGSKVYITNQFSNNISVISTITNSVIATFTVGATPTGIVVTPNGNKIYVSINGGNQIAEVNPATNTVVSYFDCHGTRPYNLTVTPDGTKLYVTCRTSDNVSVFNTVDNSFVTTIAVGARPWGIRVKPSGNFVYVTSENSNNISVINTSTNLVTSTINVGGLPSSLCFSPDGSKLYVAHQSNDLYVINTTSNSVTNTILVGGYSTGVSINADGTLIYVSNTTNNVVNVISTVSNSILQSVSVGNFPISLGDFILPGETCTGNPISFTYTVNPSVSPTITLVSSVTGNTICPGQSITFTAVPTNGGTTPIYQWRVNGINVGTNSPTYTTSTLSNNDVVSVSLISSENCAVVNPVISNIITIIVNQNSAISLSSATSTNAQTICLNSAISNINYAIAGGGTGAVITGLPAGVTGVYNSGTRTFVISGSASVAGTFNYTVTTTGPCNNASLSGTITVNAPSSLSLTTSSNSNQTICINTPISPIVYNVGGSATGANVSGLPNGVTGVFNNGVFTISGSSTLDGNFNFTITSTGPCNAVSLNGSLQITPLILPSFTQVAAVCTGSSITLPTTSSNGITGSWSPSINNTATTTYTFTPNNGQCAAINTMTVVVNSKTDPDFSNLPAICNGGIVASLPNSSNNGITGSWTPSVINNTTAGTYTFTPSVNECATPKSITTVIIPNPYNNQRYPTVNAVQNQDYQLQARAFQNANYLWTPGFGLSSLSIVNPVFNYNRQQQYNIKITTAEGCVINDTILVRMYQNCDIYVPGGFSPNGDGMNDLLFPELVGIAQLKSFKIFDRWGQMMFQTNIPGKGWDGKFKGVKQPIETYMWMAEGIDVNGNIIKKNGSTILMR